MQKAYSGDEYVVKIRDREIRTQLTYTDAVRHRRSARSRCRASRTTARLLKWLMLENVPGSFPYHRRRIRVQARERGSDAHVRGRRRPVPHQQRFHLLSKDMPAKRLSTAFDSVTLYGFDPDLRPDIYGKVGNSGVSIATLDDMKVLYSGFDLCDAEQQRYR